MPSVFAFAHKFCCDKSKGPWCCFQHGKSSLLNGYFVFWSAQYGSTHAKEEGFGAVETRSAMWKMLQFVSMLSLAFIVVNDQSRGENHTVVVYGRSYSSARGKLLLIASRQIWKQNVLQSLVNMTAHGDRSRIWYRTWVTRLHALIVANTNPRRSNTKYQLELCVVQSCIEVVSTNCYGKFPYS